MIVCKDGVRLRRVTPALVRIFDALCALDGAHPWMPPELVITSLHDGTHAPDSRHYTDEAVDLRTHAFATPEDRRTFRALLSTELGLRFTVLFEDEGGPNEHIHIQPRKGTTFP